jgi:hypothetical protein
VAENVPFAPTPATAGIGTSCETVSLAVSVVTPAAVVAPEVAVLVGKVTDGATGAGGVGAGGIGDPPLDEK